jgi:hypothetical protein
MPVASLSLVPLLELESAFEKAGFEVGEDGLLERCEGFGG